MKPLIGRIVAVVSMAGYGLVTSGQTVIPEVRIEALAPMPRIIVRPLIADSTLLFFAKDVAWHCSLVNGVTGYGWLDVDFAWLKECTCATENYRIDGYPGYYYRLISSEPRGSFVRTSDTTFTYTELKLENTGSVQRVIPMFFDVNNVVRIDTAYTENLNTGDMEIEITRFVDLKAK